MQVIQSIGRRISSLLEAIIHRTSKLSQTGIRFECHVQSEYTRTISRRVGLQFDHLLAVRSYSTGYPQNECRTESEHQSDMQENESRKPLHIPVMKEEILEILNPHNGQIFLDMTFGAGGHTRAILEKSPGVKVIALDCDPLAYGIATDLQEEFGERLIPVQGRFSQLCDMLHNIGIRENSLDGALFDCGASSMQFETAERGFSLVRDGPLDMRMEWNRDAAKPTAADVVNHLSQQGLYQILKTYGEEKKARAIAQAIIDSRYTYGKLRTTKELAKVVECVFALGEHRKDKLMRHSHVVTKTFQALRIFVNNELNELHNGLEQVHYFLKPETGKCVAISFHSLEDRIIKRHFHGIDMDSNMNRSLSEHTKLRSHMTYHSKEKVAEMTETKWTPLKKRIILASDEEIEKNPRARSAKLRAAVKSS